MTITVLTVNIATRPHILVRSFCFQLQYLWLLRGVACVWFSCLVALKIWSVSQSVAFTLRIEHIDCLRGSPFYYLIVNLNSSYEMPNCVDLKVNGYTSREATLLKLFYPPFWKDLYSKSKEFAPFGSKFFPFRKNNFSEGIWFAGKQTGRHKSCPPLKKHENSIEQSQAP